MTTRSFIFGVFAFVAFSGVPAFAQEQNMPPNSAPSADGPMPNMPMPGSSSSPDSLVKGNQAQMQGQRPTPRPLTPAEMDELRKKMVTTSGNTILSPDDIVSIKSRVWAAQGAQSLPWANGEPPIPRARILKMDRATAVREPMQLYLAYGVISPITFVDARARPWPIESVLYDPRLFAQDGAGCGAQVQAPSSGAGSDRPTSINLMPCRFNTWGNISIKLENLPFPLVFMVRSGGNDHYVDVPITIRVDGSSPLAPAVVTTVMPSTKHARTRRGPNDPIPDPELNAFADGVPPKGAITLSTTNDLISAWAFRGKLYVRGKVNLLNPPYDATADGREGYNVWRVPDLVARVLVSDATGNETGISIGY